jgi:hypothetical protein
VASGFVAPSVLEQIVAADGSKVPDAFVVYTGIVNRGYAKVDVVATCVGILLFSAAMLKSRKLSPAAGGFGAIVAALVLLLFFAGHIRLDVHGFGAITLAQSAWLAWIGALLCGPVRTAPSPPA